jgi:hypothetical protein
MDEEIVVAVVGGVVGLRSAAIAAWISWKTKRVDERLALTGQELEKELTLKTKQLDEAFVLRTKQIDEALTIKTKQMDQALEELKLWVGSYEVKMLEQRLTFYRKLWTLTEPTSRRRIRRLTPQSASALAEELTKWYYHEGGIVLSEVARDKFFAARRSLEPSKRELDSTLWRKAVIKAFSSLRTALCEDMNSRRGPRLREAEDKDLELEAEIESQAD